MSNNRSRHDVNNHLLAIVHDFLVELGSERAIRRIDLNAKLEHDLGIGSLERTELFRRLESEFLIELSYNQMANAVTLQDISVALAKANPPRERALHSIAEKLEAIHIDPSACNTIMEVVELYAKKVPNRPHIYYQDENGHETAITYGQLLRNGHIVASALINKGIAPKEKVALMLPTSDSFFYAFMGILLAGAVPVPIYPPIRADQIEEYAIREAKILSNANVKLLITFERLTGISRLLRTFIPSLDQVATLDELLFFDIISQEVVSQPDDLGLIQYTSGSTGDPKGVMLTHRNLLANIRAYGKAINISGDDVGVSWLPLYHDMGLIGTWFGAMYHGIPVTIMSPLSFLSRPERWLWTIHYHRATITAAPNFAYELCITKIPDKNLEGLDLSSLRLALNGAEAIYPRTLKRFIKKFSRYGFRDENILPVYGLAESSVALIFPQPGTAPRYDKIEREPFDNERKAVPASKRALKFHEFVSVGKPIIDHEARIVDDNDQLLPERVVGRLQFRGPSMMIGYHGNEQATKKVMHDGWLDTGDYAYQADGDYFITGRSKDIIIKAGRNIYPDEVEVHVGDVDGIRKGCVVAFGAHDQSWGTERFIVVAETKLLTKEKKQQAVLEINDILLDRLGLPADEVVLVSPKTIPKTSSGKLRRNSCKRLYQSGKLQHHALPWRLQMVKLFVKAGVKKLTNSISTLANLCYTAYFIILFLLLAISTWLLVAFLSAKKASKLTRKTCRAVFKLARIKLTVTGDLEKLIHKPCIFVANHASYLDTLVALAILPEGVAFVGKQELTKLRFFRTFIKKLGFITVNRLDLEKSLQDTAPINDAIKAGRQVMIFPEATFAYASGVRPFKMGAYTIAVEQNAPIVTFGMKGVRYLFPAGAKLVRHSHITCNLGSVYQPQENSWQEAVRLRDLSRKEIAELCDEPEIDLVVAGFHREDATN